MWTCNNLINYIVISLYMYIKKIRNEMEWTKNSI